MTRQIQAQDLLWPQAPLEMSLPLAMPGRHGGVKVRLTVEIDGIRTAQRTITTPRS